MNKLLGASLAHSTKQVYRQAVDKYASFIGQAADMFPISVSNLSNFIAYLYLAGYKASSIASTIAGISYVHSLLGLLNPANHIIVKKLLKGASKLTNQPDIRLPVSRTMLKNMVQSLNQIFEASYEQNLYAAMLSLAFHALLRIGEYTTTGCQNQHTIQLSQVRLLFKDAILNELRVTLPHYKHSLRPVTISIKAAQQSNFCPVQLLHCYLRVRPRCHSK